MQAAGSAPDTVTWAWPVEMVIEFAALWVASNYQLTLTGSYVRDREEFPGFYACVLEYLAIQEEAKAVVENTLDLVMSNA